MLSDYGAFRIRQVEQTDLSQLLALEEEWPEHARATADTLRYRINQYQEGFFIAEDHTGIIASIISHPYDYHPGDLSNFLDWQSVVTQCYQLGDFALTNALYIISGTSKSSNHAAQVFNEGVNHVVKLAKTLQKRYVIGGCLLPGYAKYVQKHGMISVKDYVFKHAQNRYLDPLIEKYRRLRFFVPDERHILADYFPDSASLNYSALVVRDLSTES